MNAALRRGACPGLSAPMQTGDGLLTRLAATGIIPLKSFAGLCAAAQAHGNGIVEITSRGSLQVRGLNPTSAGAFAAAVAKLGIDAADGVAILANPLSGLDPTETIEAGALADALRKALAAAPFAARLGPKISVVIDGGGALHLDALRADLRFRAETLGDVARFHVGLRGDAATTVWIGAVPPEAVVEVSLRLLAMIAAKEEHSRAREITRDGGSRKIQPAIAEFLIDAQHPLPRAPAEPIGCFAQRNGCLALGLGLAFGHTDTAALARLVDAAEKAGATGVRAAPGRALLLIGVARAALEPVPMESTRPSSPLPASGER
jgi:precorrin-3B synthase